MSATIELVARTALAWMKHRPFSAEARARRKARRIARRTGRQHPPDEAEGEFFPNEKESKMILQGKLTYSALGVMAIIYLGQAIGVEIAEAQAASVVGVIAGLIGAYGRWRATRVVE